MGSILDKRLVWITGKGGVGKSTVAAALGMAGARRGKRTIVCEVGAQERLSRLFRRQGVAGDETLLTDELWATSIDPQAALRDAAEILISSLSIFTDEDRIEELRAGPGGGVSALDNGAGGAAGAGALAAAGGRPGGGPMDDILIEELELGVRSYNCLKRAGIQTVGDLVSKSEGELAAIPNFGKKSIDEVIETLSQRGLGLRTD